MRRASSKLAHAQRSSPSAEEVDAIHARLNQLEAFIARHRLEKKSHTPDSSRDLSPDEPLSIISVAESILSEKQRARESDNTLHDADAEAAAILLEGLTMKSTLPLHMHRANDMLRENTEPSDADPAYEWDDEGVFDPLAMPRDSFHKCLSQRSAGAEANASLFSHIDIPAYPNETTASSTPGKFSHDPVIECPLQAASQNKGVLRLYSTTESSLGWGLGWAMSAGEELCRTQSLLDMQGISKGTTAQRIAVLSAILRTLPNESQVQLLINIFERRVSPFTNHIVYCPTLRREVTMFYAMQSTMARAIALEHVDTCWLGVLLMVLTLAIQFRPADDMASAEVLGGFTNAQYCALWRSATMTVLVLSGYVGSTKMTVLQAIMLLSYQCVRTSECNQGVIRVAVSNAQGMGLHRLGDKSKQPHPGESSALMIRREIAKRVWWSMMLHEWREPAAMIPSVTNPSFFNTPIPGNFNNEDFERTPFPEPHDESVHTDMSFMLSQIKLMLVYRDVTHYAALLETRMAPEGKDARLPLDVIAAYDVKYRHVLETVPIFLPRPNYPQDDEIVAVQRWIFQMGAYNRLIRLHRNAISEPRSRQTCVELSRKTIALLQEIRQRSDLPDLMVIAVLHSFMAAVILCLDMLYARPSESLRTALRCEVLDALQALYEASRKSGMHMRGIRVVDALLDEEQAQWDAYVNGESPPNSQGNKSRMLEVALKVARISRERSPAPRDELPVDAREIPLQAFASPKTTQPAWAGADATPMDSKLSMQNDMPGTMSEALLDIPQPQHMPAMAQLPDLGQPGLHDLVAANLPNSTPYTVAPPVVPNVSMMQTPTNESMSSSFFSEQNLSSFGQAPVAEQDMNGFWDWVLAHGTNLNADLNAQMSQQGAMVTDFAVPTFAP